MIVLLCTISTVILALVCTYVLFFRRAYFPAFIIVAVSASPLSQYIFHFEYRQVDTAKLGLELILVGLLCLVLFIETAVSTQVLTRFREKLAFFRVVVILYVFLNLISALSSLVPERSVIFFFVSVVGPSVLFYLIAAKTSPTVKMLDSLVFSLLLSDLFVIMVGFTFRWLKFGETGSTDLIRYRNLGGMYGAGAVDMQMSLILPLVFLRDLGLSKKTKIAHGVFRLVSVLWIAFALSRTSYFVFGVAAASSMLLLRQKVGVRFLAAVILGALVSGIFFAFPTLGETVVQRFGGAFSVSDQFASDLRPKIWAFAIPLFIQHPVVGIGLGNYTLFDPVHFSTPHDLYLGLLVEAGVFVTFVFVIMVVGFFKLGVGVFSGSAGNDGRNLVASLLLGVGLFLAYGITGDSLYLPNGFSSATKAYHLFAVFGIMVLLYRLQRSRALLKASDLKNRPKTKPIL